LSFVSKIVVELLLNLQLSGNFSLKLNSCLLLEYGWKRIKKTIISW